MSTITAAGHTWHHVERGHGPGCWHRDDEGGRCLSLQGVINEHAGWIWAQAREQMAEDVKAEREKTRQAEGATARDESVINGIVNGLGIALKIVRGTCRLCGGAGVVPGSEDYDTTVHMYNPSTGEPCDCVLRSES